MRYPVVDKKGYVGVGDDVCGLARGRVGGHDDDGRGGVRGGWDVGVVHEGDLGNIIGTCCEMELWIGS